MSNMREMAILSLCLISASWASAQQPATPQTLLAGVLASLGAANRVGSSLSGNAEFIAGSTEDTGSFTASCSVNGSCQLQLQLSSASRTESRTNTNGVAVGTWTDNEGTQHAFAGHNLYTPESWFCPHIVLARIIQNSNLTIHFLGTESRNGATVAHFTTAAMQPDNTPLSTWITRWTKTDIYLDPETMRPVALGFNIHPDNNAAIDIPVEIRFSNYTNAGGVWIPFTIEKFVNSALELRLQVQSAS